MYLTRKMKFNIRIVLPFGVQKPLALRKINGMTIFILSRIRLLKTKKIFQLFLIIACEPACFVKGQCSEFAGSAVLMQQTILNYLELQLTNTTDNFFCSAKLRK